jgi:tetratricopeptide (TPR) repeat protein
MELNLKRETIALLLRANELKDQRVTPGNIRKFIKYLQKNIQSALELYNMVLSEIGESPYLLHAIASCHFRLGSLPPKYQGFQEAISVMKRAIALAPNDGEMHAVLAEYYELGTNEYEDAANECRKAIELCPYDAWVLNKAANLYGYPDHPVSLEESIGWLERLIVLEPNEPRHHAFLAEQYYTAGRFTDAEREAIRALLCPRPLEGGWVKRIKQILGSNT